MEHGGETLKTSLVVFVSSAMQELEYEREATEDALKSPRLEPWLFELQPAMNESPSTPYLEAVRGCDLFVIILGQSLRPAVRMEYEEAVRTSKPILVFVKSLNEGEKREDELDEFLTGGAALQSHRALSQAGRAEKRNPVCRHERGCSAVQGSGG